MAKLNCKLRDLAAVISAHNPANIGTIFRMIKNHNNQDALVDLKGSQIRLTEALRQMTYNIGGKLARRLKDGRVGYW